MHSLVPFLLHERNEQKYHLEILCEAIMIQIIEVDAHFVGIDHGVVVFYGDFSSPTHMPKPIRVFQTHIDFQLTEQRAESEARFNYPES